MPCIPAKDNFHGKPGGTPNFPEVNWGGKREEELCCTSQKTILKEEVKPMGTHISSELPLFPGNRVHGLKSHGGSWSQGPLIDCQLLGSKSSENQSVEATSVRQRVLGLGNRKAITVCATYTHAEDQCMLESGSVLSRPELIRGSRHIRGAHKIQFNCLKLFRKQEWPN